MGHLGAEWLWKKRGEGKGKKGLKVVTVCNTGSLATSVSGCGLRGTVGFIVISEGGGNASPGLVVTSPFFQQTLVWPSGHLTGTICS